MQIQLKKTFEVTLICKVYKGWWVRRGKPLLPSDCSLTSTRGVDSGQFGEIATPVMADSLAGTYPVM